MSTHLLVGNPTAQSGKNAARIERALALFREAGVDVEPFATLPEGKTIDALRARLDAGPHTVVVAMGGDGTFREVGAALLDSSRRESIAMGMLPTGTANDQGRSFGLEASEAALAKNVAVVVAGKETRLDAGRLHAMHADGTTVARAVFFDSAGWGFSARVLSTRNEDRRFVEQLGPVKEIYRDHMVYAGAFLKRFVEGYVVDDKFVAEVVADGKKMRLEGLTDLIVKATRVYAGAWVFDRTSRHDDGVFEVVPFRGKRDWTSKAIVDHQGSLLTEEMLNAVGIEHSHPFRASQLAIELVPAPGQASVHAQIDGEEFPMADKITIDVVPRAIRLLVP